MTKKQISKAASTLGRIGGSKTSERKKKSSRENGKLGGRPKKEKRTQGISFLSPSRL